MVFLFACSALAQQISVGAYLTPAYGNITYKEGIHSAPNYDPAFAFGGGVVVNYYKRRWLLNTGMNFKHAAGVEKIPIMNDLGTTWSGKYAKVYHVLPVFAVPVGVHYAFIHNIKFKLYGGIGIENGWLVKKELIVRNNDSKQKYQGEINGSYYMGIMPEIGIEYTVTERKFLFSKVGVSYQFTHFERTWWPDSWPTIYRINNIFVDIGFAYKLKK